LSEAGRCDLRRDTLAFVSVTFLHPDPIFK
jgi:hypothetical protein